MKFQRWTLSTPMMAMRKDPEKFWKKRGKKLNDGAVESFVGKRKAMEQAVAEIVSASSRIPPETKLPKDLRALFNEYAIRLTSRKRPSRSRSGRRKKRSITSKMSGNGGYADGNQIPWLFLGLGALRASTRRQ